MRQLKSAEEKLRALMKKDGWEVIHKGWPDFACVRDGEMLFIEVKGYRGEMLKEHQHFILTNLAKLGLNCYKWTPDGGFEQILADMPFVGQPRKGKITESLTDEEQQLAESLLAKDEHWKLFNSMPVESRRAILGYLQNGEKFYW